jgi:hypothetical protein
MQHNQPGAVPGKVTPVTQPGYPLIILDERRLNVSVDRSSVRGPKQNTSTLHCHRRRGHCNRNGRSTTKTAEMA